MDLSILWDWCTKQSVHVVVGGLLHFLSNSALTRWIPLFTTSVLVD